MDPDPCHEREFSGRNFFNLTPYLFEVIPLLSRSRVAGCNPGEDAESVIEPGLVDDCTIASPRPS